MASDHQENIPEPSIVLVEPFYGGSHKQLVDLLLEEIPGCVLFTLPAKKWHWRMRTGALYLSQNIPANPLYRILFSSSVLNLAELVALRPDLALLKKILYFHENQLVYPVRKQQDRDFQYGYNQILSCLVADTVLFNSKFNMDSFLNSIESFLKLMPDFRPKDIQNTIRSKSIVLYFPVKLIDENIFSTDDAVNDEEHERSQDEEIPSEISPTEEPLHIVWPHRWEHDKDPDMFFNAMFQLCELGMTFNLSVIGQVFKEVPESFSVAKDKLAQHIVNWGFKETREDYLNVLKHADVVVSTAKHEFFGVAMMEAVCCECFPLCPNRLVYPELFPKCLYNTQVQLFKRLKQFIAKPRLVRQTKVQIDLSKFGWRSLQKQFKDILQ
ncbi:glycosyltransferase-like domain-containing protein 1 isoform X2 [Dendronephthya gigantea]|uniref:glycosyltransferase-like domain-containing protein 1 isoform X2 n=1 Tax=Dendronephthya gigantea TaxID=151771 RepID=UPI00106DC4F2|nr:glycosyltransferase-like domain-containing protein 1 isoform X2 [Dendronephthya gigantea]